MAAVLGKDLGEPRKDSKVTLEVAQEMISGSCLSKDMACGPQE